MMSIPVRPSATCLVAVLVGIAAGSSASAALLEQYGQSTLSDVNGLLVLQLRGTPAEMGYAHGRLLADEAKVVYDALERSLLREHTLAEQTAIATAARPYIPARFVEEVQAIAAGVNDALGEEVISADRLLELHSWDEICMERMDRGVTAHFAALGGGTQGGHVIFGLDYVDEQCVRRGVQNGAVAIVYHPDEGHTFATASWAGFAGVMVGVNSQGLVASEARFSALGQRQDGTPLPFQMRRVMEECGDVAAAEALLRAVRRTVTGNVMVADGVGGNAVRAFEFSKDRFEVFSEGDPAEDHTYVVQAKAVHATVVIDDFSAGIDLPDTPTDITAQLSRPLANAIVRTGVYTHHTGASPLLSLQAKWAMGFVNTDPDFDFLDLSTMAVDYPYPSLDIVYMTDKILAGEARDLLNPLLVQALDVLVPYWDIDLYHPDSAAPSRYKALGNLVEGQLGALDPVAAVAILRTPASSEQYALDVLHDPNSLHSVVIDATTMEMWIAAAAPTGSAGRPDANLQTYRKLDFGAMATYPLAVQTTPVSGKVYVKGVSWGQAPQTKRVKPGQYEISFGDVEGYVTPPDQIVTVGLDGATVTGTYEPLYSLTVQLDGQGTVTPSQGQYVAGTEVTLKATPAEGWHFVSWSGAATGSEPTKAITIAGDTEVTAHFAQNPVATFSLTTEVTGQGRVEPATGTFEQGTVATVSAIPETDWVFVRWELDAAGTDPNVQIMFDADKVVRAVFQQGVYGLHVTVEGEGTVEPPNGGYDAGDVVTLHATPADGWHFVSWSGDASGTDPSVTLTINGNTSVTARFEENDPGLYQLTVQVEGQGDVQPGSGSYPAGTKVALTATPDQYWEFVRWTGDVESTDATIQFTLNQDKTVRAIFEEKLECTLTVQIQGQGQVVLTPSGGTYAPGTSVTLKAEAGNSQEALTWVFLGWQGDIESQENPVTVAVETDMEVLAVFSQVDVPEEPAACCGTSAAPALGLLLGGMLLTVRRRSNRVGG